MNCCRICLPLAAVALVGASLAFAQNSNNNHHTTPPAKPAQPAAPAAGDHNMQLPPGMTAEDMKACEAAATPGPMHKRLAENAGTWHGTSKAWMAPGTEATPATECTSTVTAMMDGKFFKCEWKGDMAGMPFSGFGLYGYDNVAQKFQSTWVDNCTTAMMQGTGELSSDDSTLTWTFSGSCPLTKKPMTFREIDKKTGNNAMSMEIWGSDPKTGKEFKMMEAQLTRNAETSTAEVPTDH